MFLPPLYPDYLVDMLQRFAVDPYEMLSHISLIHIHEFCVVSLLTRCVVGCQLPCKWVEPLGIISQCCQGELCSTPP